MKRMMAMLLALLLVCALSGCASGGNNGAKDDGNNATSLNGNSGGTEDKQDAENGGDAGSGASSVNLKDMYTVADPEGVEFDQRVALYMPILESDEHYADGCRYTFTVLYGLAGKGVYMYNVEIYETEEQAAAYLAAAESGQVDGTAYITTSDAAFFAAMESFIPDLDTWINNMMASGMMELD